MKATPIELILMNDCFKPSFAETINAQTKAPACLYSLPKSLERTAARSTAVHPPHSPDLICKGPRATATIVMARRQITLPHRAVQKSKAGLGKTKRPLG
jgi:hypothetical protein